MTLAVHRLELRESIHVHLREGHEQIAMNVAHMTIEDAENVHESLHVYHLPVSVNITYDNPPMSRT